MTPPSTARPLRLLVVDDSPEGRRGLARLLELHGFEVQEAADGTSALEALNQAPPPDVVLTDLFLPDLDGREIAARAHTLEPRPYIGLITGWTMEEDDPSLTASGILAVFPKPIDVREVVAAVHQWVDHRGS